MGSHTLVLALSTGEIVSIAIAGLVILSGIMGQANEASKNKRRREAAKRGDRVTEQPTGSSLDDIAQRRRQQLEALARRRRPGATPGPQPTNMSTAQTVEREAARAAYEDRAATLRQSENVNPMLARGGSQESSPREDDRLNPMLTRGEAGGRAQAGADAERGALKARRAAQVRENARLGKEQRASQKQEAKLRAKLQAKQRRTREQVELVIEPQVPSLRAGMSDLARGATQAEPSIHSDAYASDEDVHRQATDAGTVHVEARKSRLASMMIGRSWREVLILKEVLDRPLSMREEIGSGGVSDPWA